MVPGPGSLSNFRIEIRKKEEKQKAEQARLRSQNLPKEFDLFCPGCLYQGNGPAGLCPRCGERELEKTGDRSTTIVVDHGAKVARRTDLQLRRRNLRMVIFVVLFILFICIFGFVLLYVV